MWMIDIVNRGERFRNAREQAGMTQEDLARAVGVTPQAVSSWESGKVAPRNGTVRAVAAVLGASTAWLMFGVEGERQD
jgi:transcriptional regulator with XRE-family HTH domain